MSANSAIGWLCRSKHQVADAERFMPGEPHDYLWKYTHGTQDMERFAAYPDLDVLPLYAADAAPVAVPQGLPELRIEHSHDEQTEEFYFAGQHVGTATYDEHGSAGMRGMRNLAKAMCAALAAAPEAPYPTDGERMPITSPDLKPRKS